MGELNCAGQANALSDSQSVVLSLNLYSTVEFIHSNSVVGWFVTALISRWAHSRNLDHYGERGRRRDSTVSSSDPFALLAEFVNSASDSTVEGKCSAKHSE